ncbi:MAG: Rap1a/Tai family immunity protein [Steroidobacteraceae bacterium]|jgi:hypothetical protein
MKTVIVALLLATSLAANAQNTLLKSARAFKSANQLYTDCTSTSQFDQGSCWGYIVAAADIANGLTDIDVCLPPGVTMQDVVDVTKKYLIDNPAERRYSAHSTVIASLRKAFSCPKGPVATPPR